MFYVDGRRVLTLYRARAEAAGDYITLKQRLKLNS